MKPEYLEIRIRKQTDDVPYIPLNSTTLKQLPLSMSVLWLPVLCWIKESRYVQLQRGAEGDGVDLNSQLINRFCDPDPRLAFEK